MLQARACRSRPKAPKDDELRADKAAAREDFVAMMLLSGANNGKYWKLR